MSILFLYFTALVFDHILPDIILYLFNYMYQWYTRNSPVFEEDGLGSSFGAGITST